MIVVLVSLAAIGLQSNHQIYDFHSTVTATGAEGMPLATTTKRGATLRSVILCPVRSRIIILGALIAVFVNVRGAQAR